MPQKSEMSNGLNAKLPMDALLVFFFTFSLFVLIRREVFTTPAYHDEGYYYLVYLWHTFRDGIWPTENLFPPESIHPPLYSWLVALILKVTGWSFIVIRGVSLAAGSLCISGMYAFLRLIMDKYAAAAIAVSAVFAPVMLSQVGMFMPDLPAAALFFWTLFSFVTGKKRIASWLFALGTITNAPFLFVGFAFLVFGRKSLLANLKFFLPAFLLSLLWLIYYVKIGQWTLFPKEAIQDNINILGRNSIYDVFVSRVGQIFLIDGREILSLFAVLSLFGCFISLKDKSNRAYEVVGPLWAAILCQLLFLSFFGQRAPRYCMISVLCERFIKDPFATQIALAI